MVATLDFTLYIGLWTRCVGVDRSPTTYCWLDGCPLGETGSAPSCIPYIVKGSCMSPPLVHMTCTRVSPSWSKTIAIVVPRRNEYHLLTESLRSTHELDVYVEHMLIIFDDIMMAVFTILLQ